MLMTCAAIHARVCSAGCAVATGVASAWHWSRENLAFVLILGSGGRSSPSESLSMLPLVSRTCPRLGGMPWLSS